MSGNGWQNKNGTQIKEMKQMNTDKKKKKELVRGSNGLSR